VLLLQAGAVSVTLPVQASVAEPLGPSVVTGLPPWLQETGVVTPSEQFGLQGTEFVTERPVTL
jgi:hypothetical protein